MATTLETLLVRIEADSSKLRNEMKKAGLDVQEGSNKIENSLKKVGAAAAAYLSVRAIKDFTAESIRMANRWEAIGNTFKAATGSAAGARSEMEYLRKESDRLGIVTLDSADAFAKLTAASRGTSLEGEKTRKIFTAIAEAGTVMRFSTEDMNGAIRALEQMVSKGVVSMEELKLQLGDRMPGAMRIAAQSMGVGTEEFMKMVANGQVLTEDFLPKFADGIQAAFKDGLGDAVNSAQADLNRMENSMNDLFNATGSAITNSDIFKTTVTGLGDAFDFLARKINMAAGNMSKMTLKQLQKELADTNLEVFDVADRLEVLTIGFGENHVKTKEARREYERLRAKAKEIKEAIEDITLAQSGSSDGKGGGNGGSTGATKDNTKAVKEQTDKLQEFIRNLETSNELMKMDERTRNQMEAVIRANNLAMQQGNLLTEEQINLVKRLADENYRLSQSYRQVEQSQSFMSKAGDTTLNVLTGLAGSRLSESLGGGAASQLLTGLLSGGGGSDLLGSVVNDFGNSVFGTGIEGLPWTGTPLSSYLGAAGMGFTGGGLIADLLGLKQTGGSFGGGAGAALGMALGGPIGAGIGTLAGSLLGGQFGGTPHPAGTFGGSIGAGGSFSTLNLLSKHMGTEGAQSLANQVAAITSTLSAAGLGLEGTKIFGGYDPGKGGGFLNLKGGDYINFNQENAQEVEAALKTLTQQLLDVADITNNEVAAALEKMSFEGKTLAQVLDDIQFQAAIPTLRESFNKAVNLELLKITDPTAAARQQIMDKYAANMDQAKLLGADTGLLERLRDAELKQLSDRVNNETQLNQELQRSAESFQRLQQSIDDTLNSLLLGNNSLLSPGDQFNLALSNFRSLAGSTDAASLAALPGAAQTLAAQNRSFYGTGPDAAAIFNEIVAGLQGASGAAGGQAAALLAQQNQLLAGIAGGIAESNNKVQILMAESSRASYAG